MVDDWPIDLVPINETRKCSKCKTWTWWATPRQPLLGRCLDCQGNLGTAVTPGHWRRVMGLLAHTFPGATVVQLRAQRCLPGTYRGPDAGPCRRCGATIRLYGDRGHPLCLGCAP